MKCPSCDSRNITEYDRIHWKCKDCHWIFLKDKQSKHRWKVTRTWHVEAGNPTDAIKKSATGAHYKVVATKMR